MLRYKEGLPKLLEEVTVPESLQCIDPQCNNSDHTVARDNFVLDLLCSMIETEHREIPVTGGKKPVSGNKSGNTPRWKEDVEPFRKDALFWHAVWKSAERPNTGALHSIMVRTRNKYHYAVNRARKNANNVRAKKLLDASKESKMDLLAEMKNIRGSGKSSGDLPDNVAGANGEDEIVEKFKIVYSELYNSWGSEEEMSDIKEKVASLIRNQNSMDEVMKITGSIVKEAVCSMKAGKGDVSQGYTSDTLKNAPDIMFDQLAMVYRSWLVHGTVTLNLLACAFLPLLKNSLKNPADTGSYRAIAGSSLLLKLFDQVVLLLWGHHLSSDSLQFGYKKGTSTTQCSWIVMEVANHFLRGGTNPIMTLLDCTKAFDMCRYDLLFLKLLDRLPAIFIRTLIFVYQE